MLHAWQVKPSMLMATLIGDVVGSRASRATGTTLHERLTERPGARSTRRSPAHAAADHGRRRVPGRLRHGRRGAARASFRLRLRPAPRRTTCATASAGARCRCSQEDPRVEDGPGWWAARDAIHEVQQAPGARRRHRFRAYGVPPRRRTSTGPDPTWSAPSCCARATRRSAASRSARCRCCVVCSPGGPSVSSPTSSGSARPPSRSGCTATGWPRWWPLTWELGRMS